MEEHVELPVHAQQAGIVGAAVFIGEPGQLGPRQSALPVGKPVADAGCARGVDALFVDGDVRKNIVRNLGQSGHVDLILAVVTQFVGRCPHRIVAPTEEVVVEQTVVLVNAEVDAVGEGIEPAAAVDRRHRMQVVAHRLGKALVAPRHAVFHVLNVLPLREQLHHLAGIQACVLLTVDGSLQARREQVEDEALGLHAEGVGAHQVGLQLRPVIIRVALGQVKIALHGATLNVHGDVSKIAQGQRGSVVVVVHFIVDEAVAVG